MKPEQSSSLKKHWRPKEARKIPSEEVDAEFKSERQELKQIESRLTERATGIDRKDDQFDRQRKTLEQKNKYFW